MGEPLATARAVLRARYQHSTAAVLGRSVLGPTRTPTSDLDLVVLLPGAAPRWEAFEAAGWLAEAFVSGPAGWERYVAGEIGQRRPGVLHVTATGVPLTTGPATEQLQQHARQLLAGGPPAPAPQEVRLARRLLTDLVDDLRGGLTGLERVLVVAAITRQTAELALLVEHAWWGSGKWLARQLAAIDARLADDLAAAAEAAQQGKVPALISVAERVLERAGGPLRAGWTDPLEELHSDVE
jgi:hypothetical protein